MKTNLALAFALLSSASPLCAQEASEPAWNAERFSGLELRQLGPAFMSGRIADVAIHPLDDNLWYLGVGSGGVWKTENAGVTWSPIFDDQPSYSIGCVTIDPHRPHRVWVGTGENVGGRHVGYGDGIYRSDDSGASWTRLGLEDSEHISKIVVHPEDPNVIWVAAQGPLWKAGGDRGLYRSADGGATWARTLGDDKWVGVTDLAIDPRDPQRLYAATWQRHRSVAAYLGGGPGSGLHRSDDGGLTWAKLTQGLPESNLGKIGLAISPQNPDVLYAAIELDRRTGAIYRSSDRGASWEKRSDTVSGGTGPHYYQELYASPHAHERVYLADVRVQVSEDGGKTFKPMPERDKHSDNHAMAFRADDPDYLLVGTDGGLYESFDLGRNWRFFSNLPLTQFYKVAVDDAEPFYNIYGGTQDNSTQGGPSRTDDVHGIQNSDWRVILDWDGHQPATEPGNPNIVYAERQEGHLARIDIATGEVVDIQPQPEVGESFERYNWDAPILVSPHEPTRIYFASQRVWRSDDRGDRWTAISGDLTRNQNRFELPIGGGTQSWDNAWDVAAMSNYNTITSLAESPLREGLIYAGTDDGLLQVSADGGQRWKRIEVGSMTGLPASAFVNDIKADLHDVDTVYVALDNHKFGDFEPYLMKSTDRGASWSSIRGNLPSRTLVWRLVQDHVDADLLFVATEFGIYFTVDQGARWTELEGGVPTISFRDLAIQRRENDLVGASFGRGFFVLDNYSVLREVTPEILAREAAIFSVRDAWWHFPRPLLGFEAGNGSQGAAHFVAPNPPAGAVFTYHLRSDLRPMSEERREREKLSAEADDPVAFPGWEPVEQERREAPPKVWLTITDASGEVVRRLAGPTKKGFHRVAWDLRYPTPDAVEILDPPPPSFGDPPRGLPTAPGTYTVSLSLQRGGTLTPFMEAQEFEVVPLRRGSLPGSDPTVVAAFWREYEAAVRVHSAQQVALKDLMKRIDRVGIALSRTPAEVGELDRRQENLRYEIFELDRLSSGDRSKAAAGEKSDPVIRDRLFSVSRGVDRSTYGPTPTHRRSLAIADEQIRELQGRLKRAQGQLSALVRDLVDAGGPWVEGEALPAIKR